MTVLVENPMIARMIQVLATSPTPREIMEFRALPAEEARMDELRDKLHTVGLSSAEEFEVNSYLLANHMAKMAKIEAHGKVGE
ncbi:MAG: hypothetical protein AAFN92_00345 [Bacteroidota bacterium]